MRYFLLVIFFSFAYAKPLIYLDAGHGGSDFGATIKVPRMIEKRYALTTAHYTKRWLEKMGYPVSLTRSRDFFVPLRKRVYLANRAKAIIFVSIHFNSSPNKKANGVEIYYYNEKNRRAVNSRNLAKNVLNRVVFGTKAKARGVRGGSFLVLRETKMPAILVEGGFLTNVEERNKIRDRAYLQKIAKGIAEGVDSYAKKN